MAGFEYMALSRMRAPERMLKQMKEYWGGMIAQGATSFWEGYDANEDEVKQYGFYGVRSARASAMPGAAARQR